MAASLAWNNDAVVFANKFTVLRFEKLYRYICGYKRNDYNHEGSSPRSRVNKIPICAIVHMVLRRSRLRLWKQSRDTCCPCPTSNRWFSVVQKITCPPIGIQLAPTFSRMSSHNVSLLQQNCWFIWEAGHWTLIVSFTKRLAVKNSGKVRESKRSEGLLTNWWMDMNIRWLLNRIV